MTEKKKKTPVKKERAKEYEEKVSFDGSFEDMIAISVKDAEKKSAKPKENSMNYFYLKFLIFSEGQTVGQGTKVTSSRDPNADGRNAVKNTVIQELRVKHPNRNFDVKIMDVQRVSEDDAKTKPNGWQVEIE